jgi:hypothetical protein
VTEKHDMQPVCSAYQPPASGTFLSEQTSHQQSASSIFLSEQISTSHQPPAKLTGWERWNSISYFVFFQKKNDPTGGEKGILQFTYAMLY